MHVIKSDNAIIENQILKYLYLDSRISVSNLANRLGLSYYITSKYLANTISKYDLFFTLDINTDILGFSEARILVIKFGKQPETKILKKILQKSEFIQDAYQASGEYDLILFVVAKNAREYNNWQFEFRKQLYQYIPEVYQATINVVEGFLPIQKSLIRFSNILDSREKSILSILLQNSRIRLKDLCAKIGEPPMKVLYRIKQMQKRGIILGFTTCIRQPSNSINIFYTVGITPTYKHNPDLVLRLIDSIKSHDSIEKHVSNYSLVLDCAGSFDGAYFCSFEDNKALEDGPILLKRIWAEENPQVRQCILTSPLIGALPLNLNSYKKWSAEEAYLRKQLDIKNHRKGINIL